MIKIKKNLKDRFIVIGKGIVIQSLLLFITGVFYFILISRLLNPWMHYFQLPIFTAFFNNIFILPILLILLQAYLGSVITRTLYRSTREIVWVNVGVVIIYTVIILWSLVPFLFRYQECKEILHDYRKNDSREFGQCMTFRENSRVIVIYPYFFGYLILSVLLSTVLSTKNLRKSKFR